MAQKVIRIREGFNVTPNISDSNNILYINNNENLNNINGSPILGNPKRCFNPNSTGFEWSDIIDYLQTDVGENCIYIKMVHSTYTDFNPDFHTLSRYIVIDCDNSTFEDSTFSHAIFKDVYKIKGNSLCENAQINVVILEGSLKIQEITALSESFPIILDIKFINYCNIIFSSCSQEFMDIKIGIIMRYLDISGDPDFYQINRPVPIHIESLYGSLYLHDFLSGLAVFKINILNGLISTGDPGRNFGIVLDDIEGGTNNIEISGNIRMIHGAYPLIKLNDVRTGLTNPIIQLNNSISSVVTNNLVSLNSSTCSMNIINSTIATTQYLYTSVSSSFSIYTKNLLTNYTGSSYVGDPKIINTITQDAYLKI